MALFDGPIEGPLDDRDCIILSGGAPVWMEVDPLGDMQRLELPNLEPLANAVDKRFSVKQVVLVGA